VLIALAQNAQENYVKVAYRGVDIKSEREGKTNQPRNNADEHGDLFYRGSVLKNIAPVEVVTKTGSLSTLSLSQTVT
jgi:hypothetical protein